MTLLVLDTVSKRFGDVTAVDQFSCPNVTWAMSRLKYVTPSTERHSLSIAFASATVSVLAPPNATVILALMIAALAVAGAIFLILELDQPFGGVIRISSEPMLNALHQFAK